jgi:hypothetical protein
MNNNIKKQLSELVGGDVFSGGNDRNVTNDSEIETGPVQKPYNDDSDYEKGEALTTDKVVNRYRQDIPWFAVYSFGGGKTGTLTTNYGVNEENKKTVLKKKQVEEKIEDLVKKSKISDVTDKNYNPKLEKIIDTISDSDLSDDQIEKIKNILDTKKENKTKNI